MARDPWAVNAPRLGTLVPLALVDGDAEGVLLTGAAADLPDHVVLRGSQLDRVRAAGASLHAWHLSDVAVRSPLECGIRVRDG